MRSRKARIIVTAAVLAVAVALGGIAAAYFTATGSGAGSALVGSPGYFAVSIHPGPTGSMYPGSGSSIVGFTITNEGSGHQSLNSIGTAVMATGNDAMTSTGSDISGCLATWFAAALDPANPTLPVDLAPNATYTGSVDVTMTDADVDQGACQGAMPGVAITAH